LNFDESVSGLIDCVDTMAKKVDSQKLRALGEKSRFTSIEDTRNKKVIELTRYPLYYYLNLSKKTSQ